MNYPTTRFRRNRKYAWLRDLVAEAYLTIDDLIMPLFVVEGINIKEKINSMPGQYRYSIDLLIDKIKQIEDLKINAVALFPAINQNFKSENADEAYRENNLICRAIAAIKQNSKIGIICDVALDPYTLSGHDGILIDNDIDNDLTIEYLCKQALVQVEAGCDIIAPSDMMDGRIGIIRNYLSQRGYETPILAYSAKYASNLYSPFREAVKSDVNFCKANKKTYQMDFRNSREAIREIEQDIYESADMIMIKPANMYLDIIAKAKDKFNIPIFAYQVSGEYAMIKSLDLKSNDLMLESLFAIKRAGANAILTYGACEVAKIL